MMLTPEAEVEAETGEGVAHDEAAEKRKQRKLERAARQARHRHTARANFVLTAPSMFALLFPAPCRAAEGVWWTKPAGRQAVCHRAAALPSLISHAGHRTTLKICFLAVCALTSVSLSSAFPCVDVRVLGGSIIHTLIHGSRHTDKKQGGDVRHASNRAEIVSLVCTQLGGCGATWHGHTRVHRGGTPFPLMSRSPLRCA